MTVPPTYEIHAIRYARHENRTRRESHFALDPAEDHPQPMDFFLYALKGDGETIVIDTGMTPEEGARRGRPTSIHPRDALARIGIDAETVETVVLTHMHFDHGGCIGAFPRARFHIQTAEMASMTGADMGHAFFASLYNPDHVCDLVRCVFEGRVDFHDGDVAFRPGITLHHVGGHAAGLQCLTVNTARGPVVLAGDAVHFYDNMETKRPFRIVGDVRRMLDGFDLVERLAPSRDHLIAGHDPEIMERFPAHSAETTGIVARLDLPPKPRDQ